MSVAKTDEIYRKLIKPLPAVDRVHLLKLIGQDLEDDLAGVDKSPGRDITELHGLGKEIWEGIDAQEYVNQLRNEWENRS